MPRGATKVATPVLVPAHSIPFGAGARAALGDSAPSAFAALGDLSILATKMCALFCSLRCPGDLIPRTLDLAVAFRSAGITVIGGFHTPMERECLALLLRGRQPIVICPARALDNMRLPRAWSPHVDAGRILLLSPFVPGQRRSTREMATERNRLVAGLAHHIFVAHGSPGGRTEELVRDVGGWGTPVSTFAAEANANLVALGARPIGDEVWTTLARPRC